VTSLAASVLREFDFLLHWDLPISTIVEFNEVGKATHVRDVVDFQDVIDTFVPFAKRFSWLSRRVAGLLTSTMGSIALSAVPGHTVIVADALHIAEQRRASAEEGTAKVQEIPADLAASVATAGDKPPELGSPIALTGAALAGSTSPNLLGLEGITGSVQSMAPDVDVDGQSQEA
jgi:hypothetical protein